MAFKIRKGESSSFSSPQEMFQDNKRKKIKGILDYQSMMLNHYLKTINGSNIINKNVAFELPTGSGKTLVGVLIAEFQRRKYSRKCVYLCPTKQLVSQVCTQANDQYGIDALEFVGKQAEYDPQQKSKYLLAQAIAVTTYSSFFAVNSFFSNPDILIFDDVHSSEMYIVDNWSLCISRNEHLSLYMQIVDLLADVIGESGLSRIQTDDPYSRDIIKWNDMLPRPLLTEKIPALEEILRVGTKENDLRFAWSRIADNLENCQIYVSWNAILIRPYIPPTETLASFHGASQRIFMSATLGSSGELERLTGCRNITRLPIVSDWDTKGLGRRLFVFPDLSLKADAHIDIITKMHQEAKRSVLIVPSDFDATELTKKLSANINGLTVFYANDLINAKDKYTTSENAMVIMANRFDGVDFPDEESRMLFIYNLPRVTHQQETFFVEKMAASILYSERIKTRIVQAVGRCTRNASDYSVVCILGDGILNDVTSERIQSTYHPELRAEIKFGVDNSTDFSKPDDIIENIRLFYARGEEWAEAENEIVRLRDQYIAEGKAIEQEKIYEKLLESSKLEVDVQYALWRKNYQAAFEKATQIVEILNAPSLSGYKCYWQYMCGCLALESESNMKAKQYFSNACANNMGNVKWLPTLLSYTTGTQSSSEDNYFFDVVDSIEDELLKLKTNNRFESRVKEILDGLLNLNGTKFESVHCSLGLLLGYDSHNPTGDTAPDPYWIVNDNLCIVAEDKIYESAEKKIPLEHVTQAGRHETWIRENVQTLHSNAKIITIFVTNSSSIENEARIYAKNIYYVNRKDLHSWAVSATTALRTIRSNFIEAGDSNWRKNSETTFLTFKGTPKDFLDLVMQKQLSDI